MKKTVQTLLFLVALLLPWAMNAQSTTVTIGEGTSTGYQAPFCNFYNNGTVELLYTADEIGMAGQIDAIAFNCSNAFGYAFNTLNIYMATTNATSLSSGWVAMNDLQLVYSATNGSLTSTPGWEEFILQTPFYYNGSENLVVVVCRQSSSYSSTHKYYYTSTTGGERHVQSDGNASYGTVEGASAQAGTSGNARANIQLSISTSGAQPCLRPTSLSVTNITSTSATVNFTPAGDEFAWLGTISPDIMGSSALTLFDTTINLVMLTPNTEYTVGVSSICSSGETSVPRYVTFRTACEPLSMSDLPYTENFNSYSTGSSASISPCWTKGTNNSTQYPYPTSTSMGETSNALYFYSYQPSTSSSTPLYSYAALPQFSGNVQNLMLTFDAKSYSSSTSYYYSRIIVGVMSDPTDISTFVPVDTIGINGTSEVVNAEVIFANYAGPGQYVAFYDSPVLINENPRGGNYNYSYIYVDNVVLQVLPTCLKPTNLATTAVNAYDATLTWNERSSATQWEVTLVSSTDTLVFTANSNPFTATGLTPNTDYYVYVRAICDTNDQSEWSEVLMLHTLCTVADSPLFSDDFESYTGDEIPECWTQGWYYQHPSTGVKTQPFKTNTSNHHSGSRAMTLQDQGSGTSSWMSTRQLPIDRSGKYALSLWVYRQSASGHPLEGLKFWASSNVNDTTGALLLGEVHRHYGAAPAEAATGWYNYQFPIETSGNKYIIIEGYSTFGAATYFDDVEVIEIPCEKTADYTENFEHQDNNMVPLCWDNSASTTTTMNSNPHYVWGTYSYNGNKMMRMYNYFVQSGVATTNSPAIVLDSLNRELVFDFSHHANSGAVYVRVSNDGGNTFTDVDTINYDGNGTNSSDPIAWTSRSISLADYAGDTIILQFYTVANYGNGSVFIDNLQIREVNNCPIPTDVAAEVLTASSAVVSWTGDAAEYVVAYGTGSNPEAMDTVHAFTTTAVINGLSAETTYNFFVQSVCGENTSYWSLPASAYTGYCQPAPTSVDGQGIVRLQFGNGDQVVDNTSRPTSAPYYGNYSTMVGAVAAGTIADVSITYQTGYTYGTIIWVDWDNSLTFDANEVVYVGEASNTNPTTLTASFPISATTATGMYRMRIAGSDDYYDSYTTSIAAAAGADPCPNSSYTIVHDYTLNVTEAANCAPVTSVVANSITNSTATISWSLLDTTQSNFAVAYGTVNDIDSMTVVNVTTPNVTLTGLTDATTYYVSVKAVCGATDQSTWSNAISFTTELCDAANQCALTVEMTDSYGDGWNGGYLNFVDAATNTTVASLTISYGSYQTASVNVCDGRTYNIVWSSGQYVDEVSFDIYNASGALILSAEEPMDGTLLAYTANCTQTLPDSVTVSVSAMPASLGSVTGAGTYAYGETVTLTAVAMPLAHFTQWSNGDTNSTLTFVATDDTAFVAYFAYNPVTVTLVNANPTMGTTTPAPGTYTYQVGDTVNAMATAFDGYQFSNWNIMMALGSGSDTTNPVMLVVPTLLAGQNITVTANFEAEPSNYVVTVLTNNILMGSVLGGGTYGLGDTATLTAMPASNSHFVQWNDGDTHAVRNVIVTSDTTFTATFAFNPVTVTFVNNNPAMGYTVPAVGTYTYEVGDNLNAAAFANDGYHFVNWDITIEGIYADTSSYNPFAYIIPAMMAGAHVNVEANWMANDYTVTAVSADTTTGTVTGSGIYTFGTTATVVAVPSDGYRFARWNDGNTDATRTFVVTSDTMFTAFFAPNTVIVNLSVNDEEMGTTNPAPGTYTFGVGQTVSATAVANDGYRFVEWQIFGMYVNETSTESTVTITIPNELGGMTANVVAIFEQTPTYTVTVLAKDLDGNVLMDANVTGSGEYMVGSTVSVSTEDFFDSYTFEKFVDENDNVLSTENPFTFTMPESDVTIYAVFSQRIGIDDVAADNIRVYSQNGNIVVLGAENQSVRVYDVVGRVVAQRQAAGEEERISISQMGVYMVQVGNSTARRVVVR